MYFVGKKQLRLTRGNRFITLQPNDQIPEAATWAGLRGCMERGEIICDYKDGEIRAEHLAFAVAPQPTKSDMLERLKSADINVPLDAPFQEICKAYNHSHLKMDVANGLPAWMLPEEPEEPQQLALAAPEAPKKRGRKPNKNKERK